MKKNFVKIVLVLMVLLLIPAGNALCGKKKSSSDAWRSPESRIISKAVGEKWWVFGKIRGNHNVITITLEPLTGTHFDVSLDTSTNKFGYYAFSDKGQGNPSNYKLVIYSGDTIVKQISLKGVRKGGRVPDIVIPY